MDTHLLLGSVAGFFTTLAFLPQVIETWSSQSARDLSWGMIFTLCVGVVLWLIYGLLIDSLPIVLSNGVTLMLTGTLLGLKVRFRERKKVEG
ncbi:MAG: hypothetical protein F6J87_14390 [Spirulina sp. SIO3F2]|nr:hypothetical protein [Spirulina sp. SIO3F2]